MNEKVCGFPILGGPQFLSEALDEEKKMREEWKNLPDPMICRDGTRVRTVQEWEEERRPEILEMFEQMEYGRVPEEELSRFRPSCGCNKSKYIMEGRAVRKTVEVEARRGDRQFAFSFVVFVPKPSEKGSCFYYHMQSGNQGQRPIQRFFKFLLASRNYCFQRVCSRQILYPGGSAGL